MPPAAQTPLEQSYADRVRALGQEVRQAQQHVRALANVRFVCFIAALLVLFALRDAPLFLWAVLILALGLFALLVQRHRAARAALQLLHARIELCKTGIARLRRDWELIPVVLHDTRDDTHPYARDLDLFGRPALTQLLGPVSTVHGKRALRSWLLHPAEPAHVARRQAAVRALAPRIEFRETLAVAAQQSIGGAQDRLDQFISFIADARIPPPGAAATWFARVIPLLTFALIIAQATDLVARAWWLLPLSASIVFCAFTLRSIYRTFDAAFSRDPAPLAYSAVFRHAQQVTTDAPLLAEIKQQLHAGGTPAATRIHRLEQIMLYADVRLSGTASILLEIFFQWSFHIRQALRRWQEQSRADLPTWFSALGELEALCSLATLAHDQPEWCFPDLAVRADVIRAGQTGHPMLIDSRRVHNDVVIGPPGTFLFVTGSNMSGKSTLLRSIGVNVVLAQAGAPVCAERFTMPPVRLYTAINVRDSLAGGVSLYMAQLQRIKLILDAAAEPNSIMCCYLLDEILSGTNSTDRTTAVRAIVHQLLEQHAIGALATHDLALADDERIRTAGKAIHFSEEITAGGAMTFDYRIKTGVVRTSNALALMKLIGIEPT